MNEYESYDAVGLAELVERGEVTPSELLEAAIARTEDRNPKLNAVVIPMFAEARASVEAGLPAGPLTGVPYLLKDLYAYFAGVRTTNGCRLFEDFVPDHDSELVVRQRRAGLMIFGKSASPEFGLTTSTESRLFGQTRNPWNPERMAGGSSGGAAAAVASGMVPAAHASDGGGSIRIPASCCGLFGLKPTRARNPVGPDVGEGWSGMSTTHAVTRSVRDSAVLLDATQGPEVGSPYWAPPPQRPYREEVGAPTGRLRIALQTEAFNGVEVHPECVKAAEAAGRLCESLGHDVEPASPALGVDAQQLREATGVIIAANLRATLEARVAELGRELRVDDVETFPWFMVESAKSRCVTDYVRALQGIHAAGRRVEGFLQDYDVLLTPTMATPPLELGALALTNPDALAFLNNLGLTTGFTQLFNASGHPAASVPLHWSAEGLPVGVQIAARFGDEATLFRLAAQMEEAQPWFDRTPPRG